MSIQPHWAELKWAWGSFKKIFSANNCLIIGQENNNVKQLIGKVSEIIQVIRKKILKGSANQILCMYDNNATTKGYGIKVEGEMTPVYCEQMGKDI